MSAHGPSRHQKNRNVIPNGTSLHLQNPNSRQRLLRHECWLLVQAAWERSLRKCFREIFQLYAILKTPLPQETCRLRNLDAARPTTTLTAGTNSDVLQLMRSGSNQRSKIAMLFRVKWNWGRICSRKWIGITRHLHINKYWLRNSTSKFGKVFFDKFICRTIGLLRQFDCIIFIYWIIHNRISRTVYFCRPNFKITVITTPRLKIWGQTIRRSLFK